MYIYILKYVYIYINMYQHVLNHNVISWKVRTFGLSDTNATALAHERSSKRERDHFGPTQKHRRSFNEALSTCAGKSTELIITWENKDKKPNKICGTTNNNDMFLFPQNTAVL